MAQKLPDQGWLYRQAAVPKITDMQTMVVLCKDSLLNKESNMRHEFEKVMFDYYTDLKKAGWSAPGLEGDSSPEALFWRSEENSEMYGVQQLNAAWVSWQLAHRAPYVNEHVGRSMRLASLLVGNVDRDVKQVFEEAEAALLMLRAQASCLHQMCSALGMQPGSDVLQAADRARAAVSLLQQAKVWMGDGAPNYEKALCNSITVFLMGITQPQDGVQSAGEKALADGPHQPALPFDHFTIRRAPGRTILEFTHLGDAMFSLNIKADLMKAHEVIHIDGLQGKVNVDRLDS